MQFMPFTWKQVEDPRHKMSSHDLDAKAAKEFEKLKKYHPYDARYQQAYDKFMYYKNAMGTLNQWDRASESRAMNLPHRGSVDMNVQLQTHARSLMSRSIPLIIDLEKGKHGKHSVKKQRRLAIQRDMDQAEGMARRMGQHMPGSPGYQQAQRNFDYHWDNAGRKMGHKEKRIQTLMSPTKMHMDRMRIRNLVQQAGRMGKALELLQNITDRTQEGLRLLKGIGAKKEPQRIEDLPKHEQEEYHQYVKETEAKIPESQRYPKPEDLGVKDKACKGCGAAYKACKCANKAVNLLKDIQKADDYFSKENRMKRYAETKARLSKQTPKQKWKETLRGEKGPEYSRDENVTFPGPRPSEAAGYARAKLGRPAPKPSTLDVKITARGKDEARAKRFQRQAASGVKTLPYQGEFKTGRAKEPPLADSEIPF